MNMYNVYPLLLYYPPDISICFNAEKGSKQRKQPSYDSLAFQLRIIPCIKSNYMPVILKQPFIISDNRILTARDLIIIMDNKHPFLLFIHHLPLISACHINLVLVLTYRLRSLLGS